MSSQGAVNIHLRSPRQAVISLPIVINIMASILPRTLARSSLSARAVGLSLSSSSSAVVRPSSGLQPSSPVASSSRLFSSTAVDLAAGQGSKEVKIKKKSKGAQKFAKGGKKAAQEDEDDEDDDSPVVPKNARGRGESLDEHALIDNTAAKAEEKMEKVVAWFQEKFDEAVSRGRGKVNGGELAPSSLPPSPARKVMHSSPMLPTTASGRTQKSA